MKRKLTQTQADEIRRLYTTTNLSQPKIGKRFGVANNTISLIVRGKLYAPKQAAHAAE